jgi:hypothetical protein
MNGAKTKEQLLEFLNGWRRSFYRPAG